MELIKDIKYACRSIAKSPAFTVVAVLTLALGIGATGVVASLVRGLLLRPLPYGQPDRLVMVWSKWSDFPKTWVSVPEARLYDRAGSLADIALFQPTEANLTGRGEPEHLGSALVTANIFDVLGVKPLMGRAFKPEESTSEPANVVILSEELWRRRFSADPNIVGSAIDVNDVPKTVVGVLPAGFRLPLDYNSQTPSALWLPLDEDMTGALSVPHGGGDHNYNAVARLKPGVTVSQASANLQAAIDSLNEREIYPRNWHFQPLVVPLLSDILGSLRVALLVLSAAVGFVLLIAWSNVANLQIVRGLQRRREFAVRVALGASPKRLLRQLLAESTVLAVLGGIAGMGLAYVAIRTIVSVGLLSIPRVGEIGLDGEVMAVIALVSIVTALLFGLVPALRFSHPDLQENLKEGRYNASGSGKGGRLQSLVVVGEVAMAVILLMGASLMIRTFWSLSQIRPGFESRNVLIMNVAPARVKYKQPEAQIRLIDELCEAIGRLPGVRSVGAVRALPLATSMGDWGLQVDGYVPAPGETLRGDWQVVTPGYLESMRIPLRAGRTFTAADRRDAQQVIIISTAMANKLWPGKDPLGRRIKVLGKKDSPWRTVVGVVGDVLHDSLTAQVKQTWYVPNSQFDLSTGFRINTMTLVIKTDGDPSRYSKPVRDVILGIDPQLPPSNVRSLQQVMDGALSKQRFAMIFLVLCSGLALGLAAVGVYGIVSFRVNARSWEIGLRMALGARAGQVVGRVVGDVMRLVAVGLAIGVVAALVLTGFLASLLYSVAPQDPLTLLAAALLLALVALVATYMPARRAALVDPLIVLREG